MKNKFKCPACGEESVLWYGRAFDAEIGIWREFVCEDCGISIEFLASDYRKVKSLLFPVERVCRWKRNDKKIVMLRCGSKYTTECGSVKYSFNGDFFQDCPYCGGRIVEDK